MRKLKLIYRIIYLLVSAFIKRFKFNIGFIISNSGTTHSTLSIDNSIDYIGNVFQDYKDISKIEKFYGKVAEVGPGDSNGVALLMINEGVNSIDLIDKFKTKRDLDRERIIQEKLLLNKNELVEEKITSHCGKEAAAEIFFKNHVGYDFIVSRAVLEHLDDPIISIKYMYDSLNKNGMMIHKIDLRDHGMFTSFGFPELTFMDIPDFIYKLFTKNTGRPNRVMAEEYINFIKTNFKNYSIYVTSLVGKGQLEFSDYFEVEKIFYQNPFESNNHIKEIFKKYNPKKDNLKSINKIVSGLFIVIEKD